MFKVPEKFRVKNVQLLSSDTSFGNNGLFIIRSLKLKYPLKVIASDGMGWEHASVSIKHRCPTWDEMHFIKKLFWDDDEDCVVQFHPPKSQYVNCHPYTLHLWRPIGTEIPQPHSIMVGPNQA